MNSLTRVTNRFTPPRGPEAYFLENDITLDDFDNVKCYKCYDRYGDLCVCPLPETSHEYVPSYSPLSPPPYVQAPIVPMQEYGTSHVFSSMPSYVENLNTSLESACGQMPDVVESSPLDLTATSLESACGQMADVVESSPIDLTATSLESACGEMVDVESADPPSLLPIDTPADTKFCWDCCKYFCFCDKSINWHRAHGQGPSCSRQSVRTQKERVVRRIVENERRYCDIYRFITSYYLDYLLFNIPVHQFQSHRGFLFVGCR